MGYDAGDRPTGVSGGASASFVYDGDGKRVLRIGPEGTTVYIGQYYEAFYPWAVRGGGNNYGPYEPTGIGAMAAEGGGGRCDLQCPDGKLDPIRCRCIYPRPTPTPGPSPTPTPTPTPV
ncbi:MAG: hypothetical protein ACPLYD_16030, partial [Anaerolineae bacterium]